MQTKTWGGKRIGAGRKYAFDCEMIQTNAKLPEHMRKFLDKLVTEGKAQTLSDAIRKALAGHYSLPNE